MSLTNSRVAGRARTAVDDAARTWVVVLAVVFGAADGRLRLLTKPGGLRGIRVGGDRLANGDRLATWQRNDCWGHGVAAASACAYRRAHPGRRHRTCGGTSAVSRSSESTMIMMRRGLHAAAGAVAPPPIAT